MKTMKEYYDWYEAYFGTSKGWSEAFCAFDPTEPIKEQLEFDWKEKKTKTKYYPDPPVSPY